MQQAERSALTASPDTHSRALDPLWHQHPLLPAFPVGTKSNFSKDS